MTGGHLLHWTLPAQNRLHRVPSHRRVERYSGISDYQYLRFFGQIANNKLIKKNFFFGSGADKHNVHPTTPSDH